MLMNTPHAVGAVVRGARLRAGLSLVELSKRAGLSVNSVQMLEAGKGNPTLDTLLRVTSVLGLDLTAEPSGRPTRVKELPRSMTSRRRGAAAASRVSKPKPSVPQADPNVTGMGRATRPGTSAQSRGNEGPVDLDAHLSTFIHSDA